jgi:hypothetical protein
MSKSELVTISMVTLASTTLVVDSMMWEISSRPLEISLAARSSETSLVEGVDGSVKEFAKVRIFVATSF